MNCCFGQGLVGSRLRPGQGTFCQFGLTSVMPISALGTALCDRD